MHLVCIDLFSKFVWLALVREAMGSATVRVLKDRVFANFSVLDGLVSYHVTCFASHDFQ
jgi:hypothetical protein